MKPNRQRPPGDLRHRAVRFGLWRAVAPAPAMVGSLLLLMLASLAVGRWSALFLLTWAAATAVLATRVGERMVVRAVCGFHRPSPTQEAALKPAWSTALRVTGTAAGDVELYVQTARFLTRSLPADAASRSPAGSWRTTRPVDYARNSWWAC